MGSSRQVLALDIALGRRDEGDDDLDEAIEEALEAFLEEGSEAIEEEAPTILVAIALAAARAALAELNKRFGRDYRVPPDLEERLRSWAKEEAERLAAEWQKQIRDGVARILESGEDDDISWEQLQAEVEEYLRKRRMTAERARALAESQRRKADNTGALTLHESLGVMTKKAWYTQRDSRVCRYCALNEAAGSIPLDQAFPSRHKAPPAHWRCRCGLEFS